MVLILFILSVFSNLNAQVEFDYQNQNCQMLATNIFGKNILQKQIQGNGKVSVGELENIFEMFKHQNVPAETIENIRKLTSFEYPVEHLGLNQSLSFFHEIIETKPNFLLCSLDENCKLIHQSYLALHINVRGKAPFYVLDLEKDLKISETQKSWYHTFENSDPLSVILVAPFKKVEKVHIFDWSPGTEGALFHEIMHARDTAFLNKWASANQSLISRGLRPDELFEKYSKLIDGRRFVDDGFFQFFLELRGNLVGVATRRELKFDIEKAGEKAEYYYYLFTLNSVLQATNTARFFHLYDLPTGLQSQLDFVKVASNRQKIEDIVFGENSLEKIMQLTIEKADNL